MTFVLVIGAGALGAVARYAVDGLVQDRVEGVFPWGTFVINVSGSFAAGLIVGLARDHVLSETARAALATGFCGAYTTFSTLTYETIRLAEDRARFTAVTNLLGSAVVGLLAAGLGLALASAF